MTYAIKTQLLQQELQKLTYSLNVTQYFSKIDTKGLHFMFYAEYDIIYQSFQMKHAAYLQKKLVAKSKYAQSEEIKRKLQVLSEKNHNRIIKYDSSVDRLLNRLQFLWNQKNIPFFHRYYFQKNIDNDMRNYIQSLQKFIFNQQKLIKSDVHIIYSIERAIKARQSCLSEFKRFLSSLSQSNIEEYLYACTQRLYYVRSKKQKLQYQIQGYKINKVTDKKVSKNIFQLCKFQLFGECYHHLIRLTLHAIQLISKWKDYLYSLTPDPLKKKQQIDYYYGQENYLLKLVNDMNFMHTSFLAKYLKFAPKNDPFLLSPLLEIQKQEKQMQQSLISRKNSTLEQSTQLKCLKRIFAPRTSAQIVQILQKLRLLVKQFQINIKNRKIFDLKIIHKINDLDYNHKSMARLTKSQVKITKTKTNTIENDQQLLSPILPRKDSIQKIKSVNNFRISQKLNSNNSIKHLPSLFNSKQNFSKNQKQVNLLRLSNPSLKQSKEILKRTDSTNQQQYIFTQKNEYERNKILKKSQNIGLQLMNHKQLQIIKQQLKIKLKKQLNLDSSKTSNKIFQNPQLADYIQSEVKKVFLQTRFQSKFNSNGQQKTFRDTNMRNKFIQKIFVQTYSLQESQLISHINFLYQKQSLLKYQSMQMSIQQLLQGGTNYLDASKGIKNLENIYFLKVKCKTKRQINKPAQKNTQKEKQSNKFIVQTSLQNADNSQVANEQRKSTGFSSQSTQQLLSNVIFTIKYVKKQSLFTSSNKNNIKLQKSIQIIYLTIKSQQTFQLQRVILKIVDFLFKHQSSQSIVFTFYFDKMVENQVQKINQLKTILEMNNCMIAEKEFYHSKNNKKGRKGLMNKQKINIQSNPKQAKTKITQIKFHFTRKDDHKVHLRNNLSNKIDINSHLNSDPFTLKIGLYGLFSSEKLNCIDQYSFQLNKSNLNNINYDYLLTQIIKNHLNSDYFMEVKNKVVWQHRLRVIIQNIMALENKSSSNINYLPYLQIIQSQNITQLNKILQNQQKSIWTRFNDLLKCNFIKMFLLQLKITLPYHRKAFIDSKRNSGYFRFEVNTYVDVLNLYINLKAYRQNQGKYTQQIQQNNRKSQEYLLEHSFTKIYLFPCFQKKNIVIGFFDATIMTRFINKQNINIKKQQGNGKKTSQINLSDLLNIFFSIDKENPNKSLELKNKSSEYVRNMYLPMIVNNGIKTDKEVNTDKGIDQNSIQQTICPIEQNLQNLIYPRKCQDLSCLSKKDRNIELYIGENIQWQYDLHLQNGIRYVQQKDKNDLWFQKGNDIGASSSPYDNNNQETNNSKKLGIVVFLVPQFVVLYSKIL